ncbi:MAG: DUF6544 family protein [Thermoleophilia bacterium]
MDAVPAGIRAYVERHVGGASAPRLVRLVQRGEMWQRPDARPMPFTATHELHVNELAFRWRARFPVAPLVALRVLDAYERGAGRLEARVLGVPVMRQRGPDVDRGEAIRYLAELAWGPHAMVENAALAWRELDARTYEVSTEAGGRRVAVRLELDEAGDLVRSFCPERPAVEGGQVVERPWEGLNLAYGELAGIRMPVRAEVRWLLPEGPFPYWRGEVLSAELVP